MNAQRNEREFMNVSLLEGKITRAIVIFAIPLFFSQLFQTLYNTVDTVLIGYFLGENSLAAMGATTALFDLIVGFCTGCGSGFGIIAGQNFGAKNYRELKKSVGQSIVLSLIIGLVLTVISYAALPALLHILNTPDEIFVEALTYIRFIIVGMLVTIYYNLAAGMLRAVGDSVTPLIILAISSVLNVFLDCFCILVLNMGVLGAAVATVVAQLISTIICLIWIVKKKQLLIPEKEDYAPDGPRMKALFAQGLSMGLMSSIVAIGSVILQSAINALGTLIIAAHTAARRMYMILGMPMFALMTSLATFVAQNTGADQYDRIIKAVRSCNRMCVLYCIILSVIIFGCSNWLIAILSGSSDPTVLANGSMYLRINIPFFFALGILLNLRSTLQGLGKKIVPVTSSVIELIGKIIFTYLFIPRFGYIGVCWTEPVIWCFMALYLMIMYMRLNLFIEKDLKPAVV
jgi:putative MATE family efflux protein